MHRNYWPHAIIFSIILIVISCILTIVVAVKNPVQLDTYYLDRYQNIDQNINEIEASQKRFESKFDIKFDGFKSNIDDRLSFEILAKNGANIGLLKPILVLTRPDTNDLNQELNSTINGSKLISQELIFHKLGRWQVLLKINDGSDIGFYKFDFYVKWYQKALSFILKFHLFFKI